MKFVSESLSRLAVGEDDLELAGVDNGSGREGPEVQAGVIGSQGITVQGNGSGTGIVEFDPGLMLVLIVGDSVQIVWLDFVDEKRWKRIERCRGGIWCTRAGRAGPQVNGSECSKSTGKTEGKSSDVSTGQIPEADGVNVGGNHTAEDLEDG